MKKTAYTFFFLTSMLFALFSHAKAQYPFLPHEKLKLQAYYNFGPFWVHAGDVIMTTDTTTYKGQECVKFNAIGYTLDKWDFVFDLKDEYSSIVKLDGFKPLFYEKNTVENGFWIKNKYNFDWKKSTLDVFTSSIREPAKDTTLVLKKQLFDVLTASYYLRTLNPDNYAPNDTIPIPIITDGKLYTFKIIYLGKGTLKKKKDVINCDIYTVANITSTFFKGENPLKVYISADPNKFVIYVEANVVVGSVKVYQDGYLKMRPVKR
ncbi:MAG: DUF3108 domain-containing protein [Bacteroidales bacterium]|nr:DUF3108 domain-containing protein [Bacteroidales bacterium]